MKTISRQEAAAAGAKRYFTGRPCKHGHAAERYAKNGQCVECARTRNALYGRAWYAANSERKRASNQAWKAANQELDRTSDRAWRAANQAKRQALNQTREATKLKATPLWACKKTIESVYAEANRLSIDTGIVHHVDHIIPLRSPLVCGLHVQGNLRAIPAVDNLRKGNRL